MCQRFVKKSELDEASIAGHLVKLDVADVKVHVPYVSPCLKEKCDLMLRSAIDMSLLY